MVWVVWESHTILQIDLEILYKRGIVPNLFHILIWKGAPCIIADRFNLWSLLLLLLNHQAEVTPSPCSKCIPKWEQQLPKCYILAANPSERLFNLDVAIQTTDTGEVHIVSALLDSGATGLFIDPEFMWQNCLTMQSLVWAIPVCNVDGTPNKQGAIRNVIDVILQFHDHTEWAQFAVTVFGKSQVILGLSWLREHNPEINWAMSEVKMSCCPSWCCTCEKEVAQDHKVCKASAVKVCTCWCCQVLWSPSRSQTSHGFVDDTWQGHGNYPVADKCIRCISHSHCYLLTPSNRLHTLSIHPIQCTY